MKSTTKHLYSFLVVLLLLTACAKSDTEELETLAKIEFAKQLREQCLTNNSCPAAVICHYQNGLYHYLIFEWKNEYYEFIWIDGYPENGFEFTNKPMTLQEVQQICNNLEMNKYY